MSEWKKVFENNVSLYCRIIIQYLIKSGWKCISIDDYTKKMPDFPVKEAVLSKLYKKEGLFPIVSQSKDLVSGFSDDEKLLNKISEPIIIFGDHTQVVKYIDFDFVLGADGTKILTVTNDYNPKFFYYLIKSINLHSNKYARHYSKLRKEKIPFQEISLPIQSKIVSFLDSLENNKISDESYFDKEIEQKILSLQKNSLNIQLIEKEIELQKKYIKQLRQNILQDAIEGKLTADWRQQNPVQKGNPNYDAEALFEQIQKERNIEKKQKDLPPITDEEKPFEIPKGWEWVKLGEVCDGFMYGTSNKSVPSGKCPVLRMGNIQDGKIDWEKLVYTNDSEEIEKYKLSKFDLLFNRTNSREMVGKTAIFESEETAIYAGYLVRFHPIIANSYFINIILNSKTHREWCNSVKTDALGQSNINAEKLKNFVAPLPPLEEQEEIVKKVETLLAKVTSLENQIQERKSLSDKLIFGIIKENLEG